MKILLISDNFTNEVFNSCLTYVKRELNTEQHEFEHINVDKEDLNYCIGCFSCWVKTPGVCIFKDLGAKIIKKYIHSDIAIFMTELNYGSYSVAIKRVLDRLIPISCPTFKKVNDEVHHEARYDKYPEFVVIGCDEKPSVQEINTIKSLADANAINYQKDGATTYICSKESDIKQIVDSLLIKMAN